MSLGGEEGGIPEGFKVVEGEGEGEGGWEGVPGCWRGGIPGRDPRRAGTDDGGGIPAFVRWMEVEGGGTVVGGVVGGGRLVTPADVLMPLAKEGGDPPVEGGGGVVAEKKVEGEKWENIVAEGETNVDSN